MDPNSQEISSGSSYSSSSSAKLQLYSFWQSSCSWRVRFALNLKGLPYEYKAVDLINGEQFSPEFERLNPLHFVPVLVDGDVVVGDSFAILLYLEDKYPQHALLPVETKCRVFPSSHLLSVLSYLASMESTSIRVSFPSISNVRCRQNFTSRRSIPMEKGGITLSFRSIRAQQLSQSKDASTIFPPASDSEVNALKIKEWEVARFQDEIAASQGIRIRRRPPTEPPLDYAGPFEFQLQNECNTPHNILEEIIWNKDIEVSQLKDGRPLSTLKKSLEHAPPVRDFLGALKASNLRTGLPALIAEVKKASPSRGVLREDFDPVQIAEAYEKGGAACLSVLTDEKYFQGGFENLAAIRNAGVKCPLLCKEFVIDAWQIYYARIKGADAILLIAAVLPDHDIKYMTKICKMLGLTALIEVHDEREMDRVLAIDGVELVGINNRNLETFEVDIGNTRKLLEGERGQIIRQKDIMVVGESGLFTPDDIAYVQEAGVRAVLVGESIVKQSDPGRGITGLFGKDISP